MAQIDNKADGLFLEAAGSGETLELKGTTIKVGTATTQKVGFYGITPVVQAAEAAVYDTNASVAGSTTAAYINTAYTSSVGTSNYTVADIVKALKNVGILAQ